MCFLVTNCKRILIKKYHKMIKEINIYLIFIFFVFGCHDATYVINDEFHLENGELVSQIIVPHSITDCNEDIYVYYLDPSTKSKKNN